MSGLGWIEEGEYLGWSLAVQTKQVRSEQTHDLCLLLVRFAMQETMGESANCRSL